MSEPTRKQGNHVNNKRKAAVNNQEINIDINKFDRIEDDEMHASKFIDYNSDTPYYDLRGGFDSAIKIYKELCEKVPKFKTKVDKAGWSLFFKISVEKASHGLIEALVERWWDTTHTFHFPFGELGFMPCDWSMLTGIDIGSGTSIPYDASKYTFSYVKENIFPEIDEKSWVSDAIRLSFLKEYFTDNYLNNVLLYEIHVNRIVRAYFMFFLGQVFFSNAKSYIQSGWLAAFEDLSLVGDYDWGSSAFSYLYISLDNASRRKVKSLNGAWQVLQYWCYEYLGVGTPNYENNNRIRPRAARWNKDELQKNKMDINKFNLMVVRRMIEGLTVESVNWYPWAKCRTFDIKELAYSISYTRMIFFYGEDNGVWYLGDCCCRQFSEPYEINYLSVIPGGLPNTSMSGITKNKGEPSKRYGCFEANKMIQLVSHDTYKKYWAHVTNGSRSKIDWDVTVYKASGDLSTITIPSPKEHATIPPPQGLSYNQLNQAYQEPRNLIAQMKIFILNETKDLSRIIKEKDDRIKELELQMAQSLQLNLNPLICSSQRNFTPSQLKATQSQLTLQHPVHIQPLSIQEPNAVKPVDQNDPNVGDMQNGDLKRVESIVGHTTKLQDDLQKLGLKIKVHEENLRILKSQTNSLDESILDMQVSLGKYHSSSVATMENDNPMYSEENTIAQIMQQEKSAAGVLCQLKTRHGTLASDLALTKDVLGIVATLGKVDDDNLSRLFSEYLGLENMMAIVCKTFEGAKSLETYDKEGNISTTTGLHGLGPSIGRPIDGRFLVICLEGLRPYAGDFVAEDPQRRLALLKPRLPSGECPPGFLGFAVNMINLDRLNLYYLTSNGNGLRETLFYSLFSRLQVYRTRAEMQLALPCISDGAVSLDGGMIRSAGVFSLGNRKDVEVRFTISSGTPNPPVDYENVKEKIKIMKWDKERLLEDMQREHTLLNHVKHTFESKKQEFVKFLAESSSYVSQQQVQAGVRR